jgi:hypothetical protein
MTVKKLILLVWCILSFALCRTSLTAGEVNRTLPSKTLIDLTVSADIDGAIGPGGFEKTQNIDVRLLSRVENCISQVMAVGRNWAAEKQLQVEVDKEVDTFGQLIIWAQSEEVGFYELVYKVNIEQKYATATFNFYDKSSLIIATPNTKEFALLKQKVGEAMGCRS